MVRKIFWKIRQKRAKKRFLKSIDDSISNLRWPSTNNSANLNIDSLLALKKRIENEKDQEDV